MKRVTLIFLLLFILMFVFTPFRDVFASQMSLQSIPLVTVRSVEREIPIGIFVYPWYGSGLGQRHWNDSAWGPVVDEPWAGYYSSLNYTYWLETFQLISDAGFDFIILSYWGDNSYEHNAAKIAIQALNDSKYLLKFCILYEPFNQTGEPYNPYEELVYDYRNYTITIDTIHDTFVTPYRSRYFEFQGKPLLLSFNPAYPPKDDYRFTTRWTGHEPAVDWTFWSHPLDIKNGCASVIPRLDNHFLPNGTIQLDVNMSHGLYERQIDTIIREYRKNPNNIEVVLFYSWNEYHERTQIEPHIDYNNDLPSTYTHNATRKYIQTLRKLFDGIDILNAPMVDRFSLGMKYLSEVQFVESLGLCKESQANPNTVWLANDNIYAYYLFNRNGSPLANSICDRLDEYKHWSNGKAELIIGRTLDAFRTHHYYDLATEDGYLIRFENCDGEVMPDFRDYADLCFWWSYNVLLQGNTSGAVESWDEGFSYYNGTGFIDKSFIDGGATHFDTYKLGLCLWSAYQINHSMDGEFHRDGLAKIESDMWRMQSPTLGGFYTGYNKNFDPDGTYTNTETTCLCLIPYMITPPTTLHNYDGLCHNTDFTISLSAIDDVSGVAETYYKINNAPTKSVSADGQPYITTEGEDNTLEYWSVDTAGNEEVPHKKLTQIKLDKTDPTANAGQDQTVTVDETVTFDASGSTDNMDIVSYEWDFGDGTTDTGPTTTHIYTSPGKYRVTLTVKDAADNADTHTIIITVFPWWFAGAIIAVITTVVVAIAVFWRKRKSERANRHLVI